MSDLDFKHGGNLKKERMDMNFVDVKKIDAFQADLNLFKDRVAQDLDLVDKKKLLSFIEARKQMLDSERLYQLALSMGDFKMDEARSCERMKAMEFAHKYYLSASRRGGNAT